MNNKTPIYMTNIFLIDWDDTLFPSTWIHKNNIKLTDDSYIKYKLYFLELDNTISTFIDTLNNAGKIYIVTNASLNWIKSCLKILNLTRQIIINKNIRIISARDIYSNNYSSPSEWKTLTFQNIIENIIEKIDINNKINNTINIISIGDALYEYIALLNLDTFIKSLYNNNFNYLLKNIKFIDKPDFNFIIEQIQEIHKNKDTIINKLEYIDLKFT